MKKETIVPEQKSEVQSERLNSVKVTLHDGKEVTMRRAKARDIIKVNGMSQNPAKQEALLIADLCMMTIDEVEDLDEDDFMTLAGKRKDFL